MTDRTEAQKMRAYKTRVNANRRIHRSALADGVYYALTRDSLQKTAKKLAAAIDDFYHTRRKDIWTVED